MAKQTNRLTPMNRVSIATMKVLEEHGLNTVQSLKFSENLMSIMANEDKIRKVGCAIFGEDFNAIDLNALDMREFREGVTRFLSELMNGSTN